MKSPRGFSAAVVFLSAIPAALLFQIIFGEGAETALHFALAAGSALLSAAAFDFRTPRWTSWLGFAAAASLSVIFFLQGLSALLQNESLTHLALQILGQRPERLLIDVLLLWFAAALLFESEGKTRILGFIAIIVAVLIEVYSYWLNHLGTSLDAEAPALKIVFLAPFVWLLIESRKNAVRDRK